MSLDFDGSNDYATLASQTLGNTITLAAWVYPDSLGESNLGNILHSGVATRRFAWEMEGTARMRFIADWSVSDGRWHSDDNTVPLTTWTHVAVTYNWGATTNDPVFYVNGVSVTVTEDTGPSGTAIADGNEFIVGSNAADGSGDRTFEGRIGEAAVWGSILTAPEIAAVYALGALAVPGMHLYWPMDDTGTAHALDFSGNARDGTISGAVVFANPPARPCGRRG